MELFKLFGTIAINNSEANNGIDETTDKAEKAHPKISAAFEKIGTAAVKVGKVVATGLGAGAAAIGALAKQSLDSYAEYEQLVGGVDTLFKESSQKLQQYAANAYATAGMSANDYMSNVTSFSAALINSVGGDTAKAADLADRALTDMADNANKMGTSMDSIVQTYQSLSRGNFAMLDNLKLGYGGTKAELERLLADAEAYKASMGEVAEYSTDNFADVVEAIGAIQEKMGIYGATAAEASSTIQGSLAATKAAWQNLLTGFADGSQDLSLLMSNLISSGTTALNNIIPRISEILGGISNALPQIMPVIAAELPVMMEALLPGLIDGAVALVVGLAQMVPSLVEMLFVDLPYLLSNALYNSTSPAVSSLGSLFLDIGEFWREVLLPAVSGVGEALGGLWNAVQPILAIFPQLFTETTGITSGFDIFRIACWAVEDVLQKVEEKITEVANWISDHSEQIQSTITGLWEEVQSVWENIGQPIWDAISECIGIVRDAFAERMPAIKEFVSGCFQDISEFWNEHLKPCFEAIAKFIKENLAPAFADVFNNKILPVVDTVFGTIKNLWNHTLKPVFVGITDFLTGVFSGDWKKAWEGIVNVFKGIINIIPTALEVVINAAIDLINNLIKGINKIAGLIGLGEIRLISKVTLPKLEEGGVLEKGQIGLLEGNGAEAVVPLDQNRAWISAVARDMAAAGIGGSGNDQEIRELKEAFQDFVLNLPEMMLDAFASMKFDVNNREFARMVKAVN